MKNKEYGFTSIRLTVDPRVKKFIHKHLKLSLGLERHMPDFTEVCNEYLNGTDQAFTLPTLLEYSKSDLEHLLSCMSKDLSTAAGTHISVGAIKASIYASHVLERAMQCHISRLRPGVRETYVCKHDGRFYISSFFGTRSEVKKYYNSTERLGEFKRLDGLDVPEIVKRKLRVVVSRHPWALVELDNALEPVSVRDTDEIIVPDCFKPMNVHLHARDLIKQKHYADVKKYIYY